MDEREDGSGWSCTRHTKQFEFELPWLEASALAFQKLAKPNCSAIQAKAPADVSGIAQGTVVVFADGLRFDLAQMLKAKLG